MNELTLPLTPREAAKELLATLPAKRMREVVERRFGLKGGRRQTLEEIGQSYKITRERVRQIEADAMRRLRQAALGLLEDFFRPIASAVRMRGEVMAEQGLLSLFAQRRWHPHLRLLLNSAGCLHFVPESDLYHAHWAVSPSAAANTQEIMRCVVGWLSEKGRPADKAVLHQFISSLEQGNAAERGDSPAADSYIGISRLIAVNPFGEYGLITWPAITPRGIKDKAHAVLAKAGEPMHFRQVAAAIDKVGWGKNKKKAHPQTVHNELIKDERFVLVGRGLYALREWGYEPGTVRDVLASLLKSSRLPLERDEIIRLASQKRMVKPQTILLNLQDRSLFKRTDDGRYTLV